MICVWSSDTKLPGADTLWLDYIKRMFTLINKHPSAFILEKISKLTIESVSKLIQSLNL